MVAVLEVDFTEGRDVTPREGASPVDVGGGGILREGCSPDVG